MEYYDKLNNKLEDDHINYTPQGSTIFKITYKNLNFNEAAKTFLSYKFNNKKSPKPHILKLKKRLNANNLIFLNELIF